MWKAHYYTIEAHWTTRSSTLYKVQCKLLSSMTEIKDNKQRQFGTIRETPYIPETLEEMNFITKELQKDVDEENELSLEEMVKEYMQ